MILRFRDRPLPPDLQRIADDPKVRQLVSSDINAKEAERYFRDCPWALAVITPSYYFFKQDES